ncbi:hypothetical protein PACILC2_22440 [Paenibacillus cisolokensis]|uniref:dUTP diphosphatase n=1 Tax=Paenibacillus cisolokensis TaxID=1658519 RepID=A0ABQ4N6Y9_9BACL|nr:dUTP diphosphatase [Paenibacillus cisolokensis]GIQ63676.1 hypothetical protein PACILC2_22440 [Paenibacillus cisolokensis]
MKRIDLRSQAEITASNQQQRAKILAEFDGEQGNAINVKVRKLSEHARIPTYTTPGAAGFDLYAVEDVIIAPGETKLVRTGLAFEIPPGYEMQLRPRSGISLNTKLRVANAPATIDSDFRGEVGVIIENIAKPDYGVFISDIDGEYPLEIYERHGEVFDISNEVSTEIPCGEYPHISYLIRRGDRICQGVIAPVIRAEFTVTAELSDTQRGAGGFGSTGTRDIRTATNEEIREVIERVVERNGEALRRLAEE